ncbi:MAG TPA: EamA family transporter [Firmicutes bacterium]|nr:EamA family transporter [Candidatus Fermentithermobacillaceae bacterium]
MTGYIEIVGAGVIWATTGPFVRFLSTLGWSPWDIVLGRALFATAFMGLWLLVKWYRGHNVPAPGYIRRPLSESAAPEGYTPSKFAPESEGTGKLTPESVPQGELGREKLAPDRGDIVAFLLLGILAVMLSQISYFYALSATTVAVAVTLNYTAPFFVLLISLLFLGEKVTREKVIALFMAFLGVVLISGLGEEGGTLTVSPLGFVAGLLSGASYGAQTVVYKKLGRKYGPVSLNFWTMAFGGSLLFCVLSVWRGGVVEFVRALPPAWPKSLFHFALMGLGPGTTAFILFADGINKVEATRGSIAALAEPLAAYVIGYFFLGESLSLRGIVGALSVLSAIAVVSASQALRMRKIIRVAGR